MSFEEQFPSIHNAETIPVGIDEDGTNLLHQDDVMAYCLDKQRVREAIPKIIDLFASGDDKHGVWGYDTEVFTSMKKAIEAVEKELGL